MTKKTIYILLVIQFILMTGAFYFLIGAIERQNTLSICINLFTVITNLICIPININTLKML